MRAPDFWYQPSNPLGLLLAPLGWLYDQASQFFRRPVKSQKISIPVVCIGNITVGGAGKTPVVADLVQRLSKAGIEAHVLSRGYGGLFTGPLRVDPAYHSAAEVGDEPLMLSALAPVWIAADKLAGAKAAEAAGAKLIILDDGMQNPSLHKDFSVLVLDGHGGLGNGRIFPAGPLREKPEAILKRIDAVVFIGAGAPPLKIIRTPKPFLRATPQTSLEGGTLRDMAVYAFCGLGIPEKFFNGLKAGGAEVKGRKSFPDHHPYTRHELEQVLREAEKLNAVPVTTAKDATRIPPDLLARMKICALRLAWQDEAAFEKIFRKIHALVR